MANETKTYRFGPGSLEGVEVAVFAGRRRGVSGMRCARVSGSYVVYAPSGEYVVLIDEGFSGFDGERAHDEDVDLLFRAYDDDEDAARELAENAIGYALEGWTDPNPIDGPEDDEDDEDDGDDPDDDGPGGSDASSPWSPDDRVALTALGREATFFSSETSEAPTFAPDDRVRITTPDLGTLVGTFATVIAIEARGILLSPDASPYGVFVHPAGIEAAGDDDPWPIEKAPAGPPTHGVAVLPIWNAEDEPEGIVDVDAEVVALDPATFRRVGGVWCVPLVASDAYVPVSAFRTEDELERIGDDTIDLRDRGFYSEADAIEHRDAVVRSFANPLPWEAFVAV